MDKIISCIRSVGKRFFNARAPPSMTGIYRLLKSNIMEGVFMNEKYLLRLQEDLRLKNFTQNTCNDYYRFTKRLLEFTGKPSPELE